MKKHESTFQSGLFFWAEPNGGGAGAIESFAVVSQADGAGRPCEAWDDWFANEKDADEIAQELARGNL